MAKQSCAPAAITRSLRQRNGVARRDSASHERPRQDWIEVPVPPLVSEEVFALAQNSCKKIDAIRRDARWSRRCCKECWCASSVATHCIGPPRELETKAQLLSLHRLDGYRRLKGPVCTNRPVRQDRLDQFVWDEMIRLLDDPALIQAEIDRRREAARQANPLRKREEELRREQARLESIERLINAYQEGLVSLPQLRQRMPELRRPMQAVESELLVGNGRRG